MRQKYYLSSLVVVLGVFVLITPVKAFYFEMPKSFQNAIQALKAALPTLNTNVKAEEGQTLQPITPPTEPTPAAPTPIVEPQQPIFSNPVPPSGDNPPPNTCRINGTDQPGSCDEWKQKTEASSGGEQTNFQPQQNPEQNNMQGPDNERMLKDLQRGAKDIQKQLKQFENMILKIEKKGVVLSAETKAKIAELKEITDKALVTTAEEATNLDMNEMWEKMRDLEEERRNLEQMDNILREMKRIESSIKTFEKQIQKLTKQKLAVPPTVTESLEKVKLAIADIKAGKMDNAQDIFELVQNLDENRNEMEMLARWPQTMKEVDRQVKNLENQLKQAKKTTDRLIKKGIDISEIYTQFESAVLKIKQVRDEAKTKIQESAEDAFDLVQNDFFGQMDDVMENQRIIMTMGNFGQFQTDFNRETNNAAQQIKSLKRQKIDTAELENLLAQIKEQGAMIKVLFKAKPLDVDAVVDSLGEVENLGQEFESKVAELTGKEADMPWEKGPQQFQQIQVSPNLDKWIPQPTKAASDGTNN